MKTNFKCAMVAILILGACSAARADFSFSVSAGNSYSSVGRYDYYPYGVPQGYRPRISFHDVMSDYGDWVYAQPFGQVWRPYADYNWRPYLYGHWIYTQYGSTWQGYEPWAWVGYHYGNWIFSGQYGWVWIPGYDWHPGRVAWSYGQNEIGWTPAPPYGYDYCGGRLHYHGAYNQFTYNDAYGYGGGYNGYDNRYRDLYSNAPYSNFSINLWVFIDKDHYRSDNYADHYLDRNRTRDLFTKRAVRVSSQPIQRTQLEQIVKQRIEEVPVDVREVQTEGKTARMIIPRGEEERIRKNAGKVVHDVIKPAFEKEHRKFKGQDSQNEKAVQKIFKQEPAQQRMPDRKIEDRRLQDPDENSRAFGNSKDSQDRFKLQEPSQRKGAEVKSQSFETRTPQIEVKRQEATDFRDNNRDPQFDRNTQKPVSSRVKPDRNDDEERTVLQDDDDTDNKDKQADLKKDSGKNNKKLKNKDKKVEGEKQLKEQNR